MLFRSAADGSRGAVTNPILQGQHPEYLVKQLTEFKAGKRVNAVMNGMAATLSEADMKNVAAFYASKQAKPGASKNKDTVLLGEKIYRGGIAEKQVPACAGCHSPNGAGIPAQYPRLAGQHSDYTELQLKNFRDGIRKNNNVMTGVAAKMNDREIKAVADYVAGLVLPQGTPYRVVFRLVSTVAFTAYAVAIWQMSIWYSRAWGSTLRSTLDGLIYALVTAGAFGWLWPR